MRHALSSVIHTTVSVKSQALGTGQKEDSSLQVNTIGRVYCVYLPM